MLIYIDMSQYPKIKDKNFYDKINKVYKKYKIKDKKKSMNEICFPKSFKHQIPQQFVAKYINPATSYTGLLVFHRIGAGKTCSAVNIAEQWKNKRKIIVVTPAALIGNFKNELRSKCAGNYYLKDSDRQKLKKLHPKSVEYKVIIKKSDEIINRHYQILSYNKFIDACKDNTLDLKKKVLIIDEIQNMVSESGSYYKILYETLKESPKDLRIVLLSATPIFDKPIEIALTMNLLQLPIELPIGHAFNNFFMEKFKKGGIVYYKTKNMDILKDRLKGYISYFRGAPPYVFPTKEMKYVKCKMNDFQYKSYLAVKNNEIELQSIKRNIKQDDFKLNRSLRKKYRGFIEGDILNLPNNFFIGTRFISNIAFPNKGINEDGYKSFSGRYLDMKNLKEYSIKFYKILKKLKKCDGTVFIYSNFKEYGGIKSFIKVLEHHGFKDYIKNREGKKRYAVWSGDEKNHIKEEIKTVFNKKQNSNGSLIKVLLGSPSIKEGVSLLRVQQVHIMEPYWNISRLEQVIGRAIRYCSHKDMPRDKRTVQVFLYITTHPNEKETIDQYIQKLANYKNSLIKEFELALKECAVDCSLNKNANVFKGEENIKCYQQK